MIAVEFLHDGDCFLVWVRDRGRPELFRGTCAHVTTGPCPYEHLDILTGGTRLPRIPRRLLNHRVLVAVARGFLEHPPHPQSSLDVIMGTPPTHVTARDTSFFDREALP